MTLTGKMEEKEKDVDKLQRALKVAEDTIGKMEVEHTQQLAHEVSWSQLLIEEIYVIITLVMFYDLHKEKICDYGLDHVLQFTYRGKFSFNWYRIRRYKRVCQGLQQARER